MDVLIILASVAISAALSAYLPRLFPKFPPGTPVLVSWSPRFEATYLGRKAIGFHAVQITSPEDVWEGRTVTVATRSLTRLQVSA